MLTPLFRDARNARPTPPCASPIVPGCRAATTGRSGTVATGRRARAVIDARLTATGCAGPGRTFPCCSCGQMFDPGLLELALVVPFWAISRAASSFTDWEISPNDVANLTCAGGVGAGGCNQSKAEKPRLASLGSPAVVATWIAAHPEFAWMHDPATGGLTCSDPFKRADPHHVLSQSDAAKELCRMPILGAGGADRRV